MIFKTYSVSLRNFGCIKVFRFSLGGQTHRGFEIPLDKIPSNMVKDFVNKVTIFHNLDVS